jgi:hypothetical protein
MSGVRRPWKVAELEKAEKLRALGLPWRVIGERLDRPYHVLEVQFCRWKKGIWGIRQPKTTRIEAWCRMAEEGWKAREIAEAFGVTTQNVCVALRRRGLDAEVRREYRDDPLFHECRP